MDENLKTWYSDYDFSRTGLKAINVYEPKDGGGIFSKEQAYENFKDGLDNHVDNILRRLIEYSDNVPLKRRLQKYGCNKSLNKLMQIEQTLNSLKTLLDEDTTN